MFIDYNDKIRIISDVSILIGLIIENFLPLH